MSTLITGAGLVGSQIAALEVERGSRPVLFDVAPQATAIAAIVDPARISIVRGDVLNPYDLAAVIQQEHITHIIHTAANPLLTIGAERNPYSAVVLNTVGTLNVLEGARLFHVQRVVLCSSGVLIRSMAGGEDQGDALKEEAFPRPTSFYATSKQAAENLGINYARAFGMDFRAVRFCAVFGPWQGQGGGGGVTQRFKEVVERGLRGEEITYPDHPPEESVYSKDAAQGALLACHTDETKSKVFNIGMGQQYTSEQAVEALRTVIPAAKVNLGEAQSDAGGRRSRFNAAQDITRARTELGYEPRYDLAEALHDFVEFYSRT
ncbi:MAG: NAD(P)-dependent oxidoreductase [Nitrospirales bacterium]